MKEREKITVFRMDWETGKYEKLQAEVVDTHGVCDDPVVLVDGKEIEADRFYADPETMEPLGIPVCHHLHCESCDMRSECEKYKEYPRVFVLMDMDEDDGEDF